MTNTNRLTHVAVDGLFGRHNVELDLVDTTPNAEPRLRIIFDENGRGKTTLLKMVHHLLSSIDLDVHLMGLAELPIERGRVTIGATVVAFEREVADPRSCTVSITKGRKHTALNYDPTREDPRLAARLIVDRAAALSYREELGALCESPILVSDDRVIYGDDILGGRHYGLRPGSLQDARRAPTRDPQRVDRRDPSEELRQLLATLSQGFLQSAFMNRDPSRTDAVYADMLGRIAGGTTVQSSSDIPALQVRAQRIDSALGLAERYGLVGLAQLRQVESTLSGLRRNSRNKKTIATVLEPFFTTLEADVDNFGPVATRIHLLVSTVNSYLREKEMAYSPASGLRIVGFDEADSQASLDPAQLSSGERHLLLLFGSAMVADRGRLILIDEPELSLGISWKRQLLRSLLELTEGSQAQFLVASHSVEVISPYRLSAIALRSD